MRFIFLWIFFPLLAFPSTQNWPVSTIETEEESLFLQRIADFWQEGEYEIAKCQIEEFLKNFPTSAFSDPLRLCIGDFLLRENQFSSALQMYASISSPEYAEQVFLNRMQCLYHLGEHQTVSDECEALLTSSLSPDIKKQATRYLALSLYQQCLNEAENSAILLETVLRAKPYFEALLREEHSLDLSQAFAYLCCITKDFSKATQVYLELAENHPSLAEEMTFQAALIQSQYDKELALRSFEAVASQGGAREKEAAYHQLVLSFETGRYEELAAKKEKFIESIQEEHRGPARLYMAKSLLSMDRNFEAAEELIALLSDPSAISPKLIHTALIHLLEAGYRSDHVDALDLALARLSELDSEDPLILKGRFSRALIHKKRLINTGSIESFESLEMLRQEFKNLASLNFSDQAQALFEGADLEYQAHSWEACREKVSAFMEQFPKHNLTPFAWRYFATASMELVQENPENIFYKEQLAQDLSFLLQHADCLSSEEQKDWQVLLAKTLFDLNAIDQAAVSLKTLLDDATPFSQEANASLLLSLCLLDKKDQLPAFCAYAEAAISKEADLMDHLPLHIALFNAYLEQSKDDSECVQKSAEHLYQAFSLGTEIEIDNLLWLAELHLLRFESERRSVDQERAFAVLNTCLKRSTDALVLEAARYNLGKLYSLAEQVENQIEILEELALSYTASPAIEWRHRDEASLLLAEGHAAQGSTEKAVSALNQILGCGSTILSKAHAQSLLLKASLQTKRIQDWSAENQELVQAASQFKNLILQKRLANEPVYLEAALEYIHLLEKTSPDPFKKRLVLIEKIKHEFEKTEDLLSSDYQQSRAQLPIQNKIYESYMLLLESEKFLAESFLSTDPSIQKELQTKAKTLLLQIASEKAHPLLMKRAAFSLHYLTEETGTDGLLPQ